MRLTGGPLPPPPQVCPADCSGRGRCEHGFCWCDPAYFGVDCAQRRTGGKGAPAAPPASPAGLPEAATPRRRPLIYVYDLPKEFNIQIFQYRWDVGTCTNRRFNAKNDTEWKARRVGLR